MRILADESVDFPIVERLRELGYNVLSVAEISPGIPDTHVLHMAVEQEALLLTADKDFGELVFRQRRLMKGVVLNQVGRRIATAKGRDCISSNDFVRKQDGRQILSCRTKRGTHPTAHVNLTHYESRIAHYAP